MSIIIIGTQYIHQKIKIDKERMDLYNAYENFSEHLDMRLIDLTEMLYHNDLDVHLIANFSSDRKYMLPLSQLEQKNIKVYPVLQDETMHHLTIETLRNEIVFDPHLKLDLAPFQIEVVSDANYVLSNNASFEMLSYLSDIASDNIIVYDTLPVYRALAFVQGLVLKSKPDNSNELMLGGLSWIVYPEQDFTVFQTLKHKIHLDYFNVDELLVDFLKLKKSDITSWLSQHKI